MFPIFNKFIVLLAVLVIPTSHAKDLKVLKREYNGEELEISSAGNVINIKEFYGKIILNFAKDYQEYEDEEPVAAENSEVSRTTTVGTTIVDWVEACLFPWQTKCLSGQTGICFIDEHCGPNQTCCVPPRAMPCCVPKYDPGTPPAPYCKLASSACTLMNECGTNPESCKENEVCCYPGSGAPLYCCPNVTRF